MWLKIEKISREYRYLHGTGTVIKSTVVVPWYRQYRPSLAEIESETRAKTKMLKSTEI